MCLSLLPVQRPIGFPPHLGWCHVTQRLWSHNSTTTSTLLAQRGAQSHPAPVAPYLRSEPWTSPLQPPHDSPTGALDQVGTERAGQSESVRALQRVFECHAGESVATHWPGSWCCTASCSSVHVRFGVFVLGRTTQKHPGQRSPNLLDECSTSRGTAEVSRSPECIASSAMIRYKYSLPCLFLLLTKKCNKNAKNNKVLIYYLSV